MDTEADALARSGGYGGGGGGWGGVVVVVVVVVGGGGGGGGGAGGGSNSGHGRPCRRLRLFKGPINKPSASSKRGILWGGGVVCRLTRG